MPPTRLVSTYQRYKQDTNVVASWLASTALACGFPSDRLKYPLAVPKPSSSGRSKGKQRRKAKRTKQQQQGPQPKHIIAVADFVTLAEFIASSKSSSISLPDFFTGALHRVISLRSSFRDRLAREGVVGDAASDETHDYFIKILDQVRTTLEPLMPTGTTKPEDLPSLNPLESLNLFEKLKLYEPSQEFLDAPTPAPAKPDQNQPSTSDTSYEAEASATFEELFFAWTAMLDDITILRLRIKSIWLQYRNDEYDAAVAALATNTAIDLARGIMEQVLPLAEQFGGCRLIANCIHYMYYLDLEPGPNNGAARVYDLASDTLVATHSLLEELVKDLDSGPLPVFKESQNYFFDPTKNRQSLTAEEKAREDKAILLHLMTEQMAVVRLLPDFPVEDEFLRGMKELDRTREVTFSLAFAAQVQLDIHHVLREHATTARDALLQASRIFDDEITAYLDFHKTLKSKAWPESNDKAMLSVQEEMRWVCSDPVHRARAKALVEMGMPSPQGLGNHLLLVWSPVMAGLMLFRFRAHSWKMGMLVNQAWDSILYCGHLFDVLKNEQVVSRDQFWQDMEIVKSFFGRDQFYVGDPPKTRPEYLSKFCLSVGISATMFAPRRNAQKARPKNYKAPKAKAGPRGLKDSAAVSQMFFARYLEKSGQIDWTPEYVGNIISHSRHKEETDENGDILLINSGKSQKARRQDATAEGLLSPSELISKLARILLAESMEMTFLYLRMHRECWMFMTAIGRVCDPLLQQMFTPKYLVEKSQLMSIVGWIFKGLNSGEAVAASLLVDCARVVGMMTSAGYGDVVCRAMGDLGFSIVIKKGEQNWNLAIQHHNPLPAPIPE